MKKQQKIAFITGATGQDSSYLIPFLLDKGYIVHGLKRRSSSFNTSRIDHLYQDPHNANKNFYLHYGDMTDSTNLIRLIKEIQPDEIYNLAAMSHVKVSFDLPEYTANVDALGTLRMLEAIRLLGLEKKTKFYQASSSEMFGKVQEVPQTEKTPFYPRSPYGCAKVFAHYITQNYRESYGIFACSGILFNHESPNRGETFVTRKITRAVARYYHGFSTNLYLGNLEAERDFGSAKDYVEGMWRMLQQDIPDDYILATNRKISVRTFVELAFQEIDVEIYWQGTGINEEGINKETGEVLVKIDPEYFRPAEVDLLIGDYSKARNILGWEPKIMVEELIVEMVKSDIELFAKDKTLFDAGYEINIQND